MTNSYIQLKYEPVQGDRLNLRFEQDIKRIPTQNIHSVKGYYTLRFGPLILGLDTKQELELRKDNQITISDNGSFLLNNGKVLTPLFSKDSDSISLSSYSKQILFKLN